jgi:predicted nuclease with TOPRIM domain
VADELGLGGIIAGVAGAIAGIVGPWLEHRGKFVRLKYERDAAVEERERLRAEVDEQRDEIRQLEREAARWRHHIAHEDE